MLDSLCSHTTHYTVYEGWVEIGQILIFLCFHWIEKYIQCTGGIPISPVGHLTTAGSPRPHSTGNGMLEVPQQNGFRPASCSSPLPSSHTPSPGLSNGSPTEVRKTDFRPANLKVVIPPNSGPLPQSHQQSGSLETGGLLGISRQRLDKLSHILGLIIK